MRDVEEGWVPPLLRQPPKPFFCKYEVSKLVSFVALLHYLDHGSVTRRAFHCHVGEMIPAPADV